MARIIKLDQMERRKKRIRSKIMGTKERPRLSLFKSNKYIYAQVINDDEGKTLASFSSFGMKGKSKLEQAKLVGEGIAKEALKVGIKEVVFDRSGYLYAGKIEVLANSARESGLKF